MDTFTSFLFDVSGRNLVMDHCSLYLFSHGFGLFTYLLLSYLHLLLSLKMLVALWPSLKNNLFAVWCLGRKRRNYIQNNILRKKK